MRFTILSLFPSYFDSPLQASLIGRARQKGLLQVELVDIRQFATGRHQRVDDRPYGGGPGMVLMVEPLVKAIRHARSPSSRLIYLSPQGRKLDAPFCHELSQEKELLLVCGHYEGFDQRLFELEQGEEVSIGDYVLPSGCSAALVLLEAVSRLLPGVVGNPESLTADSFESEELFDYPHYTQPRSFEGLEVPSVLLSGDHSQIARWRHQAALEKSLQRRL